MGFMGIWSNREREAHRAKYLVRYLSYVEKKVAGEYLCSLDPFDEEKLRISKDLGRFVRAKRTLMGMSQEEFADHAGFHRTYVGFLERGERTPTIATLARLARAFEIRISDMLRGAGY